MFETLEEIADDPNWHFLREGLVLICLKTLRSTEDSSREQLESGLKNRSVLGDGSFARISDEAFLVDLKERGIDADQLAQEILPHLTHPLDRCVLIASTSQGAAIRCIK